MPYINCRSVESDAVEGGCRRAVELCGEKRSRPEWMERMAKVKCWGGKGKQGEKEKEGDKQKERQRGMG